MITVITLPRPVTFPRATLHEAIIECLFLNSSKALTAEQIADEIGSDKQTIVRRLNELERRGSIRIYGLKRNRSGRYAYNYRIAG